ncbi:MAG: phosphoglucomutase/phosphomannomutase family protein [Prochlorothrix sp.]
MVVLSSPYKAPGAIRFGTDGWRGIIGADFTFDRLYQAALAAAVTLAEVYGGDRSSQTVIVGYDRRFLSEEFAQTAALAVQSAGLTALLSDRYAPTPAFSWAAYDRQALGALVITASHNPGSYSGLKVKGAFGGSVPPEVTQHIEQRLAAGMQGSSPPATPPHCETFDPWESYCQVLRSKVNIEKIRTALQTGQLLAYVDAMHGAAAGGLGQILDYPIPELRSDRDPLFGGSAPEPLARHLEKLMTTLASPRDPATLGVGFVFDGDADRIAAVGSQGQFLSSQILIPILIEHLASRHNLPGELVKTVSGSDLMPMVAKRYGLSVSETAVGYKYIADRMLQVPVLLGGEESGGIGYGNHIPERDGLLSALYLLEAMVDSGENLDQIYDRLCQETGFASAYDRIDLPLASQAVQQKVRDNLEQTPPTTIADQAVVDCITTDGYKFRLEDDRWLMIRFSGTEPLLRLYCEGPSAEAVQATLTWAKDWAESL